MTGLAQLDTYPLDAIAEISTYAIGTMLERDGSFVAIDDCRLTAMAAYARLIAELDPAPPEGAPTRARPRQRSDAGDAGARESRDPSPRPTATARPRATTSR